MKNNIIHKVLDNGLNVFLVPLKDKHTVFINLIVKYGGYFSDFECEGKRYHIEDGMAHLLEHLNYEHNSKGNFSELFGKKQMNTNAVTFPHMTEYFVDTVENIDYALKTLIEGVSNFSASQKDIDETKEPIYQEIKMRADQVGRQVVNTRIKNAFQKYSYINGLGTIENVKNFGIDDIKLCYDVFYQPNNEALFVVGNIEPKKIIKNINDIYSNIEFNNINFSIPKIDEPKSVDREYEIIKMKVPRDYVDVCYKIDFSMYKKEDIRLLRYYLHMFVYMYFSKISPLYNELKDDNIIDGGIGYSYSFFHDYLLINASAYVNDEREFVSRVKSQFEGNYYSNKEVFDLELKSFKISKICSHDLPKDVAGELIGNFICFNYASFDSVEEINNLNYEDYLEFINSLEFKYNTITKVVNIEDAK